jgi:hypothetical protein
MIASTSVADTQAISRRESCTPCFFCCSRVISGAGG